MFCSSCGEKVLTKHKYCASCGHLLVEPTHKNYAKPAIIISIIVAFLYSLLVLAIILGEQEAGNNFEDNYMYNFIAK